MADISGASASCKIYVNIVAGLAGPHLEYPPISRGRGARAPLRRAQRRLSGGLDTTFSLSYFQSPEYISVLIQARVLLVGVGFAALGHMPRLNVRSVMETLIPVHALEASAPVHKPMKTRAAQHFSQLLSGSGEVWIGWLDTRSREKDSQKIGWLGWISIYNPPIQD